MPQGSSAVRPINGLYLLPFNSINKNPVGFLWNPKANYRNTGSSIRPYTETKQTFSDTGS